MTFRTLILRSLRHHWRAHLGVVLGAAVGSAALIGALVVGDSVKESLRERALERIGSIRFALSLSDRFVTSKLADMFSGNSPRSDGLVGGHVLIPAADALVLPAVVSKQDGSARANSVNLIGIAPPSVTFGTYRLNIWSFGREAASGEVGPDEVWLNESLADQLGAMAGETLVFRVHKPSKLSRDAPITPTSESSVAMRFRVAGIRSTVDMGNFGLRSGQTAPLNAFCDLSGLQRAAGLSGNVNVLLTPDKRVIKLPSQTGLNRLLKRFGFGRRAHDVSLSDIDGVELLTKGLHEYLSLNDLEASLRAAPNNSVELVSARIFLDPPLARAAVLQFTNEIAIQTGTNSYPRPAISPPAAPNGIPLLTYLVTQLRTGTNYAPYSMVTAAGAPWTPTGMRDDEIALNQWLADDLQVKPGDSIEVSYFLPESGARLAEATNRFHVHSIVPMTMPWADRTLMPEFPGIEKAERTQDWDAGFPLTLKIRDQDEAYWKQWRGTPKAFVTLAAGQKMWGNRFGNLTAIRWPVPTNAVGRAVLSALPGEGTTNGALGQTRPTSPAEEFRRAIEANLLANLNPADLGLRFEPVREQALKAAAQSQDFGGLFIGFSFFLIAAALILMSLLFRFGLEQRVTEVGTLLALGFTPKQVRRLFLGEGVALAAFGTALGLVGGVGYAWLMIRGLTTIWRDAIASSALSFHVTPGTLVMGAVASVLVCAGTLWLTLRKLGRQPTRELLAGQIPRCGVSVERRQKGDENAALCRHAATERVPTGVWHRLPRALTSAATIAWGSLAAAVAILAWAVAKGETSNAEVFFSAGSLLLIAGIAFAALLFDRLESRPGRFTLPSLGLRGCTRRRNRSLAVVGLLACGSFLIAAIGAFKLDANTDAWKRASGTGGFALLGESTLPVVKDLNTPEGLDFFSLDAATLTNVSFVPLRVRDGDDASCLNLNRAQKPRLFGVKPEMLAERGAFTFAKVARASGLNANDAGATPVLLSPWMLLGSSRRQEALITSGSGDQSLLTSAATNEVAAIGDLNSILWAMGKKVGDTLDYVDERGQPFKIRLVGAVANSVLQGSLLIDEAEFVQRFPGEAGYRMFLIDTPSNRVSEVSAELSRGLQNLGLEVTPAARRLAQFNAVQNTYLNTFQVLGGLGLLLGSAGLGVVVLRNVLERRNEFGVLQAVGFRQRQLQRLVLGEHGALLLLGLAVGIGSALVAVLPSVLAPAAELPWRSLTVTLGGVLAVGLLATWLATRWALRGKLTDALRNE